MEQTYPFYIFLYLNENRYLVNAFLETKNGYLSNSPWIKIISRNSNNEDIINIINEAFTFIEKSPLLIMSAEDRSDKKYNYWTYEDQYDTVEEFTKDNIAIMVNKYEDGRYGICAMKKYGRNHGYNGYIAPKEYFNDIYNVDFYTAFKNAVALAEEFYKKKRVARKYEIEQLELHGGEVISFYHPKDPMFQDMQSGHDACLYRVFEYFTKSSSEPVAAFYLGTGDNYNLDISEQNILSLWKEAHGEITEYKYEVADHGIFSVRAEMINKKCHVISYIKVLESDSILECTMELEDPLKRKSTNVKLSRLFNDFSNNIKFVEFYSKLI